MDRRNFIEGLINKFTIKLDQDKDNDQLIDSLIFLGEQESYCRSYPEISDIIYHLEKEKFKNLKSNFALLEESTENKFEALLNDEKFAIYSNDEIAKDLNKRDENENRRRITNNLLRFERHI